MLPVGKYRHLTQCSNSHGQFVVLALDHRGNLISDMQKSRDRIVSYHDVTAFKKAVLRHLAQESTATLIDPDYGLPALADGFIPGQVGLLAPLEVTDYNPHPSRRQTNFILGWDVTKLKQAGFSGAKLLLYFHPEADNARSQTELVDEIVEQCQQFHVPLFLEPIAYSLNPERHLTNEERHQIVIHTAKHFTTRGVDILKLEFPLDVHQEPNEIVWKQALEELNGVCTVPWTLLSAGVPFDVFLRQAKLACEAGASGVIAGRAIWTEAIALDDETRDTFLATIARQRMQALKAVCRVAQSWKKRTPLLTISEGWYRG